MNDSSPGPGPQHSPRPWPLILAALVAAEITATFESQMILAALKDLYTEFRDPVGVGWLLSAYLLVAAASAAICGRLGDLYGRKRMLVFLLSAAMLGSMLSAWGPNLEWVIAGRALQGVAGAVFPLSFGLLREHMPESRMEFAGGALISASGVAAILGLVIGGLVVDNLSWRDLFWLSAGMAAGVTVLTLLVVPKDKPRVQSTELDVLGGILFVPGIGGLMLAVSKASEWGISDPTLMMVGGGAIALLIWWVRHELTHPNPLLDIRALGRKEIAFTNLAFAFTALGPFQLTLTMMLLLQQSPAAGIGFGLTATAAGALKIPANVASVLISPLAGYFCRLAGERWIIRTGLLLNVMSWSLLFLGYENLWFVLGVLIASTVGTAICYVGVSNNIARIVPAGRVSESVGVTMLVRSVSHACGSQIVTVMLGGAVLAQGMDSPVAIYFRVFAFVLVASVVGLLVASALPSRNGKDTATSPTLGQA